MAEQEVSLISLKDNGQGKSVQTHQDADPLIGGVPLPFSYFSHMDIAPDWDSVDRDSWLRSFWKKFGQDMLQAVLAVSVAKVQTQNWVIEGPEKSATFYHSALRDEADFGKGFGYMVARGVIDYYTQDNGWFIEKFRASKSDHSGPCLGFAHLDSSRMKPTGNAEQPYAYMDVHGEFHLMHRSQFIRIVDMPTPEVQLHGDERGYCALSRALSTAMVLGMLVAMKREKLADLPPSALAIFNNINKKQFDSALNLHAMQEEAKGNVVWRNVLPLFGIDPAHPAALDFVSLREVWEGFDEMTAYNVAAYSFAAAWRIDPREFWPVSQGPLGTGKEADIQHQKAKAKSTGLLFTEIERAFNHKDTLPKDVTFKFAIQDSEEEEIQARIHGMQVSNIKAMQEAGAELSTEEVRFMLSRVYKVLPTDLETPMGEDDVFAIDKTDVWIDDVERHSKEFWGPSIVIDSRGETKYMQEGFKQRYQIPDTIPKDSGGFASYARQVRSNTRGLWAGQIEYLDYLDSMRFTIQSGLRRAWMEGRREGGLTGDLGDEEKVKLSELVTNEVIFSAQFADAIEKDSKANGGKLASVLKRAEMWSLSYKETANWALLFSGKRLEWRRGATKEPCSDALRLDGRVYNAKVWQEWGVVPQSRELECGGWRCACSLSVTDKPVTPGRPPKLAKQ